MKLAHLTVATVCTFVAGMVLAICFITPMTRLINKQLPDHNYDSFYTDLFLQLGIISVFMAPGMILLAVTAARFYKKQSE